MIGKIAPIFCLLLLLALPRVGRSADNSAPAQPGILVLRNGEILEGQISQKDDRYVVVLTDGEIRLLARDVDFLCHSLDEAYEVQSKRIVGQRIEDRLQLANWCMRNNLIVPAAREITAAKAIDPNDRRAAVLERRLQEMLNPTTEESASKESADTESASASDPLEKPVKATLPANTDDLERLARNLPRGTLESYSTTILPMLLNHCSTAGCHSVGTQSKFVLLRPTPGSATARRLTLRDLHNTLDWIDYDTPASSKLLTSARQAHGTCTAPAIEKEESREYQQLVSWIILATQGEKNAGAIPASVTGRPTPKTVIHPVRKPMEAAANVNGAAPQASADPSPAGAGWVNTLAPPAKVPPSDHTPLMKSRSNVASKNITATVADPNVKPATATTPVRAPAGDKD